ncbi:hypothetical protein HNQ57_003321 [Zhongshania antarctica]|uniref:Transposase n=1 Tax=Zhongshania antarctica TaxID=641702 RepID=A0A840R9I6_9GAMM|nr:hypothetical protein [Zhongshania antarctica]
MPVQRHAGENAKILAYRKQVYEQARLENPMRWSGHIRNWELIKDVYLNPEKPAVVGEENKAA